MKKYTIEEIKDQKLAVNCHSYEEGEKISMALQPEWYKEKWGLTNFMWLNSINFSICSYIDRLGWMPNDEEPNYYVKNNIATAYIDFNQVIFEEEFVLPEKWCVCPKTKKNLEFIKQWAKMYSNNYLSFADNAYTSDMQYYTHVCAAVNAGYKEIKFEEFKQHVLKEQQTMENKIIGYKWKEDKKSFYKAYVAIINISDSVEKISNNIQFAYNADAHIAVKEAGVLDLWFTPVYEESYKVGDYFFCIEEKSGYEGRLKVPYMCIKENESLLFFDICRAIEKYRCRKATPEEIEQATIKTVRMGGVDGFDLTVKGGKVYHKSEDITDYVNNVNKEFGSFINNHKMNSNLDFTISDMIIAKSRCESKKTMLSEWVNIYKLINT